MGLPGLRNGGLALLAFALGVEQRAEVVEQVELPSQTVAFVRANQVFRERSPGL